jgi:hypothetical protein
MSKFALPTAHIALPEEIKTSLAHADSLMASACALINEIRGTNELLQQLLLHQIASTSAPKAAVERARRVCTAVVVT